LRAIGCWCSKTWGSGWNLSNLGCALLPLPWTDDGKLWLEVPDTKGLVRDEIVWRILPIQRPWVSSDTGRARRLSPRISNSASSTLSISNPHLPPSFRNRCFPWQISWIRLIIVGASPVASSSNPRFDGTEVEVGLIDCEFASPARIGQDTVQLSAWLYFFSTSLELERLSRPPLGYGHHRYSPSGKPCPLQLFFLVDACSCARQKHCGVGSARVLVVAFVT
jgi:hypothetical protein